MNKASQEQIIMTFLFSKENASQGRDPDQDLLSRCSNSLIRAWKRAGIGSNRCAGISGDR